MAKDKVLVIGASGQIGVELTQALRKIYGNANVVASDLREENELLKGTGPYVSDGRDEQGDASLCPGDPAEDISRRSICSLPSSRQPAKKIPTWPGT